MFRILPFLFSSFLFSTLSPQSNQINLGQSVLPATFFLILQLDFASGFQSSTLVSRLILRHHRIHCWITHLRAMFWIVILPLKNVMKLILQNKCQTSYWNIRDPLPSEWNQWNFFSLQFPSSLFLVVVLCQITNLFQDPKNTFCSLNLPTTQFKMWILCSFMPLLHQHMVYDTIPYPYKCRRESSVFSYPYSLLLITTPSTFAWYPRDWYACFSVPEPARLPVPWEEKPQFVHFVLSWINNDYMWKVCDRIFLSELRGVFHFSVLLKSSQTYLLHLSFPHWTLFSKKLINWFMIREVSELMTYSHNRNLHLERLLRGTALELWQFYKIPFCSADHW